MHSNSLRAASQTAHRSVVATRFFPRLFKETVGDAVHLDQQSDAGIRNMWEAFFSVLPQDAIAINGALFNLIRRIAMTTTTEEFKEMLSKNDAIAEFQMSGMKVIPNSVEVLVGEFYAGTPAENFEMFKSDVVNGKFA